MKTTKLSSMLKAMALGMIVAVVPSCGREAVTSDVSDPTKANLSIGTLDAGIGGGWLEEAAARFEELYKDSTDFEEGKTGVKITVKASRSYDGEYLLNQNFNQDIMFTEAIDYYALANSGKIADITELMNADLSDYGDAAGTTILSKIDPAYVNFLNKGGKYYGVPFYESFYGFVYDVDLWEEDGLYFSKNGGFTGNTSQLAAGPDGEEGTYDDGMPATYSDFAILLKKLKDDYGKAFVISTDEVEYMANLMFNFWAMNEGYDGMNLQYSLLSSEVNGKTADNLINTINSDGTYTYYGPTEITKDNGYMLQRSEAKYQVLKLMQDTFCSSSSYYTMKTKNTDAQAYFIKSKYETDSACPMCVEGSWFENEASGEIDSCVNKGYGRGNYAVMPIPRADASQVGTEQTRLGLSQSYGMISSGCQNMKLAVEFMKFLHSDKEMVNFTKSTGMTKPLNYTIPDADAASLSTYTQSLLNIKKTHKIFYPYSTNSVAINHQDDFGFFKWAWNSSIGGTTQTNPWVYLRNETIAAAQRTAAIYFEGCYSYYKNNWSSYIK